jgi:hypothetical protein
MGKGKNAARVISVIYVMAMDWTTKAAHLKLSKCPLPHVLRFVPEPASLVFLRRCLHGLDDLDPGH